MKTIFGLLLAFFVETIIYSCNQDSQESKLIGKWKGTHVETSGNMEIRKTPREIEFNKSGKAIIRGETTDNLSVVWRYKVEGDTIFWINEKGEESIVKDYINFLSETTLSYTSNTGGKTDLEKVKE